MPLHAAQRPVTAVTADYASSGTSLGEVMVVTGTRAITLPAPSSANQGCVYTIKNAGTGTVTVHATSGNIDGAATFALTVQYSSIDVVNDGTNWFTV